MMKNYEKILKHIVNSRNTPFVDIDVILKYFPELKESDDEKIRKSLIKSFENQHSCNFPTIDGFTRKQIIAWLEKQVPKPKSEWNKEDKLMIQDAIHWIQEFQKSDRCKDENDMQNSVTCENWLKSFKPQAHWKPSKEQMEALEYVTRGNSYPHLTSLYQDLKSL